MAIVSKCARALLFAAALCVLAPVDLAFARAELSDGRDSLEGDPIDGNESGGGGGGQVDRLDLTAGQMGLVAPGTYIINSDLVVYFFLVGPDFEVELHIPQLVAEGLR